MIDSSTVPQKAAHSRLLFGCASAVLMTASVSAQENMRSHLLPITAPIRHAGVFHAATGTWTRGASLANLTGPDVIYNNSCAFRYFARQQACDKWQHRSRVPSPTGPITSSVFYGAPRNDEAPGCRSSYTIQGFEVGYCSSSVNSIAYLYEFADSYLYCGEHDMVPTYSVTVAGMPGGDPSGAQRCWTIDIDLGGVSPPFVLQADGDGVWTGPSTQEQFGWSFGPLGNVPLSDFTGPMIAGNFTWTGGPFTGVLTPCTGTDGTIWDSPTNLAEEGTGMASNDFFRLTGTCMDLPVGCYFFGGNPHADFYLRLFADAGCAPGSPMASFCHPRQAGVIACPCGNPPSSIGRGCQNSSATGGATLGASGSASLAADTVVFTTQGERASALSILAQGTAPISAGAVYGQGVRCVGGSIKRLYTKLAFSGSIIAPQPADPSVSARSAARGDPVPAGGTRYYFVYYRDPVVLGGCSAASTFNATQGGSIPWSL